MFSIPEYLLGREVASKTKISQAVERLARNICTFVKCKPVLICVEEGAKSFFKDLTDCLTLMGYEFDRGRIKAESYDKCKSTGIVTLGSYEGPPLEGRYVIIVEDIIDSCKTIINLIKVFKSMGARNIEVCALLFKKKPWNVDWVKSGLQAIEGLPGLRFIGIFISNFFVVGKGMDYEGYGRDLEDVRVLTKRGKDWIDRDIKRHSI